MSEPGSSYSGRQMMQSRRQGNPSSQSRRPAQPNHLNLFTNQRLPAGQPSHTALRPARPGGGEGGRSKFLADLSFLVVTGGREHYRLVLPPTSCLTSQTTTPVSLYMERNWWWWWWWCRLQAHVSLPFSPLSYFLLFLERSETAGKARFSWRK